MTIKAFCIALLLSLPLSAQAALAIQHWQTPHGTQVIFVESHELPILDISVDFPAGSARDPGGQAGLAQLTHILLDQGAGSPSDTVIAHRLADVGAELGGTFDRDRGGVTLRTLSSPAEKGAALDILARTGVDLTVEADGIRVKRNGNGIQPVDIETHPFPGFPTDLQAQFMALMTMSQGTSHVRETIFENRYMHVAELARFGADIAVDGQVATIHGKSQLKGAQVMATDLRASVSLVIAGLAAKGETVVNRIYHLDRGFERLEDKLSRCGAEIERLAG